MTSTNPTHNKEVQSSKKQILELECHKIEKHATMEKIEEIARLYIKMIGRLLLLLQTPL
ncbi:hypothetical protein Hanom_Chr00s000003g01602861 [Helianthus anomalus]